MTIQAAALPLDRAGEVPTSSMSEARLFDGYRVASPVVRRVRCACGDWLSAPRGDDTAVLAAVVTHNKSTAHSQWRARQEEG